MHEQGEATHFSPSLKACFPRKPPWPSTKALRRMARRDWMDFVLFPCFADIFLCLSCFPLSSFEASWPIFAACLLQSLELPLVMCSLSGSVYSSPFAFPKCKNKLHLLYRIPRENWPSSWRIVVFLTFSPFSSCRRDVFGEKITAFLSSFSPAVTELCCHYSFNFYLLWQWI